MLFIWPLQEPINYCKHLVYLPAPWECQKICQCASGCTHDSFRILIDFETGFHQQNNWVVVNMGRLFYSKKIQTVNWVRTIDWQHGQLLQKALIISKSQISDTSGQPPWVCEQLGRFKNASLHPLTSPYNLSQTLGLDQAPRPDFSSKCREGQNWIKQPRTPVVWSWPETL